MKVITYPDFFYYPNKIYEQLKKLKFYDVGSFNTKYDCNDTWPGLRSDDLKEVSSILYWNILQLLQLKGHGLNIYKEITMHSHIRLENDEKNDWIHVDATDTALIFISTTNTESGTKFYKNDLLINDVKFIQGNCVYFETGIPHTAYGHHGNDIDNGRMTINIFMHHN